MLFYLLFIYFIIYSLLKVDSLRLNKVNWLLLAGKPSHSSVALVLVNPDYLNSKNSDNV